EDGIRDWSVTGVQTCALPISSTVHGGAGCSGRGALRSCRVRECKPRLGWNVRNEVAHGTVKPDALTPTRVLLVWLLLTRIHASRSEERRVGKEGRGRGWACT